MKEKVDRTFIPIFRTPRSIANDNKIHISKILSAIFCHNIQPVAFADETPVFNTESANKIVKLARRRKQ